VDSEIAAVVSSQLTIEANATDNASVFLSDITSDVGHLTFDLVAANLPFHLGVGLDKSVALQFVTDAEAVLCDGGSLLLVANRFLKYEPHVNRVFGNWEIVREDGRYKVLRATKSSIRGRRRYARKGREDNASPR
jgi:16S rRNA (guanine1207-N2)-methyltransferase